LACNVLLDAELLGAVLNPTTSKSHQNNMYPKIVLRDGKQVVILDEEHDLLHLPMGLHWKATKLAFITMTQMDVNQRNEISVSLKL
jgi:3-polyprenyl-4-hydroxybenzoate decarboxylase